MVYNSAGVIILGVSYVNRSLECLTYRGATIFCAYLLTEITKFTLISLATITKGAIPSLNTSEIMRFKY